MKDNITSKPLGGSESLGRLSFWEHHNEIIFYGLVGVLLLIYGACLYFQAATASIGESYQPGIDFVKKLVTPGFWIISLLLTALLMRSAYLARLAVAVSGGAILVCVVMFCLVHRANISDAYSDRNQVPRMLSYTIHQALFNPSFSNRSYFPMFYGSIFACLYYWAASAIYAFTLRRP